MPSPWPSGVKDITDNMPDFAKYFPGKRILICRHAEAVLLAGVWSCPFCQHHWRDGERGLPYVIRRNPR